MKEILTFRTISPIRSPQQQKLRLKKLHKFQKYLNVHQVLQRNEQDVKSVLLIETPQARKHSHSQRNSKTIQYNLQSTPRHFPFAVNKTVSFSQKLARKTHSIELEKLKLQTCDAPNQSIPFNRHTDMNTTAMKLMQYKMVDFTQKDKNLTHGMFFPKELLKSRQLRPELQSPKRRNMKYECQQNNFQIVSHTLGTSRLKYPPPNAVHELKNLFNEQQLMMIRKTERFRKSAHKTIYHRPPSYIKIKQLKEKHKINEEKKQEQFTPWVNNPNHDFLADESQTLHKKQSMEN